MFGNEGPFIKSALKLLVALVLICDVDDVAIVGNSGAYWYIVFWLIVAVAVSIMDLYKSVFSEDGWCRIETKVSLVVNRPRPYGDPGLNRLSLTARLAVALHCFEKCSKHWGIKSPLISEFLDHMWEFPVGFFKDFSDWVSTEVELVHFGLGDECPEELIVELNRVGVSEYSFRKLTESTIEIVFSSFYAAADDLGSMQELRYVTNITKGLGLIVPNSKHFSYSQFRDRHGWGKRVSSELRDHWRSVGRQ